MTISPIPFPSILNDLSTYCKKVDAELFAAKVARVHTKCLRRGKIKIANAIERKYVRQMRGTSDRVLALKIALMAEKNKAL
jgi:predicted DNA-binding protein (UPF0278 family)